ncbi:MAG: DNA mismatch repair endonuclease MutL [Verrucomicrobia bacterium]|nr:DNA mismatch repair endonuclease MutL [Verrucomicrobiota bacterium]
MGKIRVLADEVASQVAAGEVVERPASLVKELVENSLDAGAGRIWVEFQRGGARLVTVRDDGCGMDREDALLCLERHATSKIRQGADLMTVRTMGFRGEALPSIASVSHFRLVTREHTADMGVEVRVSGGKTEDVREVGTPPGTQIEVRDLFFNLPARRKFLRGEETESAHIVHGIEAIALANPKVAFECRRDGKTVRSLPQAKELAVRIRDLYGQDFLDRLDEVEQVVGEGFAISGYLARPGQGRRDRLQQHVILNGRPIVCAAVQQPLREAYADAIPRGEHPPAVLVIEMDPEWVDCNVHPAKREVRLRQPDLLKRAVYEAARGVITRARRPAAPAPVFTPAPARPEVPAPPVKPAPPATEPATPARRAFAQPAPQADFVLTPEPPLPAPVPEPLAEVFPIPALASAPAPGPSDESLPYRILGGLGDRYLVLEGDEGMVLLDEAAAAERILFEALVKGMESGGAACQHLLIPALCELPAREFAWVIEHLGDLREAGFSLDPFGNATVRIDGLPAGLENSDPARLLNEVVHAARSTGKASAERGLREALARSVSRLAAQAPTRRFPERLVRDLLRCALPYASPDGRPTMIQFSFAELARKFGRR